MTRVFRCLVAALLGGVLLGTSTACEPTALPPPKPATRRLDAFVLDMSDSGLVKPALRCRLLRPVLARDLTRGGAVDLLVLGSGGEPDHEPVPILTWRTLEVTHGAFRTPQQAQAEIDALVDAACKECEAAVAEVKSSAVYMAIWRGADSLHARSEVYPGATCELVLHVSSDMREGIHPDMKAALDAAAVNAKDLPAVEPLPLAGVEVHVCGPSETIDDPSSPAKTTRAPGGIFRAWKSVMGASAPAAFDATCET